MFNQAFNPTQARGLRENFCLAGEAQGVIMAATPPTCLHWEREHPAEVAHLLGGDGMAGMACQPRIVDRGHAGMISQESCHLAGIFTVGAHAIGQRADATQQQPAIKGRRHRAAGPLDKTNPLEESIFGFGDNRPAQYIAVATEIFGRRMNG